MNKVNVLVMFRPHKSQGFLKDIAAMDSQISVKDGTDLFAEELEKSGRKGTLSNLYIEEARSTASEQKPGKNGTLDTLLAEAEVIYGLLKFPDRILSRAPRLKWIHIGGVGIEIYRTSGIFDGNVTVTNSKGALAVPIAETALTYMLTLAKNVPRLIQQKQERKWQTFDNLEVRGKTVGIIGLGAIGSEIAKLTKAVGMNVIGTRRSATKRESGVSGVDELYPVSELNTLLAKSDFVVVAAPFTPETKNLLDEAKFRTMKPTAYLVNISRGGLVDQAALIKALKEGWIAGAGLDVFEREPLPTDSELWQIPNAILSPHMSGFSDKHNERLVRLFCDNLKRYLANEPLMNVIDLTKEY